MQPAVDSWRLYPAVLAAVGAGALVMAYTAQYGFDLEPCVLCLYQRIPYAIVALLGFVGLRRPATVPSVLQLAGGVFAAGAAIAVYHFGVEQHWWASATGCTGGVNADISSDDLMKAMTTKPPKPCDAVDWTLLGVSMAGWNVVFSSLAAGASLWAVRTLKGTRDD